MTGRYLVCAACVLTSACAMAVPVEGDAGADDGGGSSDASSADAGRGPSDAGRPDLPDVGPPTCADPTPWYRDLDGDGHGDASSVVESCEPLDGFVASGDDCDDACSTCHPGASEVCNGRDDDCDGAVDQSFACVPGAMVACATSCGTMGLGACTSACEPPAASACMGPDETCDGADDDCDGRIDETFTCAAGSTALCTTACGTTGTGTCTSACEPAAPSACTPPADTCNGLDDDCSGEADDAFACALGSSVTCTTSCGTFGTGTCTSACGIPTGAACTPPHETCNGTDDDCDGTVDDGFACPAGRVASCTTTCGSTGRGTCDLSCMPADASSCIPPAETCTDADDDCDGLVDEDVMRGGSALVQETSYDYSRPRVARGTSKLYALYSLAGRNWLWRLNFDGTIDRSGVALELASQYDLASNPAGRVIYARIQSGDVWVHALQDAPTYGALYRWSTLIDTNAVEVHVAVGSTQVWIYTRSSTGRIEFHTLDLTSGSVVGTPTYVATSPMRFDVTSNGYRHHTVAVNVTDWIFWFQYDAVVGRESSGVLAVDTSRLNEFAIAGDYSYDGAGRRHGLIIAYSLIAGGGQPAELRYYSWREGGTTTDQRIATGTTPYSGLYPQLELAMEDGIAQLAAAWTSSSTGSTGAPRVYQLSRDATGAGYSARSITFGLPSERHDGLAMIRFRDSAGAVADRMFYDPSGPGFASVPIGCP